MFSESIIKYYNYYYYYVIGVHPCIGYWHNFSFKWFCRIKMMYPYSFGYIFYDCISGDYFV